MESGDDVVLKKINKGYTAAQARDVLEKIDASGLPYVVNFLNGAGGHEYGLTNARLTASLYACNRKRKSGGRTGISFRIGTAGVLFLGGSSFGFRQDRGSSER